MPSSRNSRYRFRRCGMTIEPGDVLECGVALFEVFIEFVPRLFVVSLVQGVHQRCVGFFVIPLVKIDPAR